MSLSASFIALWFPEDRNNAAFWEPESESMERACGAISTRCKQAPGKSKKEKPLMRQSCIGTPPSMKKSRIEGRVHWPRDRFLIVSKSQQMRLIRVCVGTTQCCPSRKLFFWDGARRGESFFCSPMLDASLLFRTRKQKNWEFGDGDTLSTVRRM
jgi:hypothetical protein